MSDRLKTNPSGDDFRILLNKNNIGNSDITIETLQMINSEITSQVTNKMNQFNVTTIHL